MRDSRQREQDKLWGPHAREAARKLQEMRPDADYRYEHCKAELSRGHVARCPKSWLRTARRVARERGDTNMIAAVEIALTDYPFNAGNREMRRLAGRSY